MVDYTDAIKRPFSDFKKLLLGLVFSIIPIVNFISLGYQLECSKNINKNLPEWKEYGMLFVRGLSAIIIWIIYSIPVMVIFFLIAGDALLSLANLSDFNNEVFLADLLKNVGLGLIAIVIVGIIIAYIGYYAIINYARNYRFKDAFDFSNIFLHAFTKEYFFGWIIGGIYSMILGIIGSLIPFIGPGIAGFISGVTFLTILGSVYKKIN